MSGERLRFVVDASVAIKLFVDEPLSDAAYAFFAQLTTEPPVEMFVPDLFYIECANVLLKIVRRFALQVDVAQADLADLKALTIKSVPTAAVFAESLSLAHQKNLTAYDACYAVLAQEMDATLITADQHLAQMVAGAVWLGDFSR
jgi:predicted nucleic acid-binding protein